VDPKGREYKAVIASAEAIAVRVKVDTQSGKPSMSFGGIILSGANNEQKGFTTKRVRVQTL
jgi:hypothetical protein